MAGAWESVGEVAPSAVRPEDPRLARWAGWFGAACVLVALFLQFFAQRATAERTVAVGAGWRVFFLAVGVACLLLHAARDADLQVRRTYGVLGLGLLALAIVLSVVPGAGPSGALFLPYGYLCFVLALLFLLAFARHETDPMWRQAILWSVGVVGVVLAAAGFVGSNLSINFLLPYGALLASAGLFYWWALVVMQGSDTDVGHRTGLALGAVGILVVLVGLGRSIVPPVLMRLGWMERLGGEPYFTLGGVPLMLLGLAYAAVSAGLTSDRQLVVLSRRELGAYFYSPIAYVILFGLSIVALFSTSSFLSIVMDAGRGGRPVPEPIVQYFVIDFLPVVCVLLVVPALTMRLMSEERRTGTLEVLLTAPVDETPVVLSKFLAGWLFFLLVSLPWAVFLIALRVEAGTFDYRPLISFIISFAAWGAAFVAMGLFFSSLTRNQIAAAMLTGMGMLLLIGVFFVARNMPTGSAWAPLLSYMSFIHAWINSLQGKLYVRDLLFPVSAAIFWLFLTTKVLEARKWA